MTVYPAISLHQPWATLIATPLCPAHHACGCAGGKVVRVHADGCPTRRMVKRFKTRSRPCPPKYIGQRVAIHAAARRPTMRPVTAGAYTWLRTDDWHASMCRHDGPSRYSAKRAVPLPLGAVVATAVITASLPIVQFEAISRYETPFDRGYGPCVEVGDRLVEPDRLTEWYHHDGGFRDISDQLPYGDWRPGRWAWALADVEPLAEPVPWKGRQGWFTVDLP